MEKICAANGTRAEKAPRAIRAFKRWKIALIFLALTDCVFLAVFPFTRPAFFTIYEYILEAVTLVTYLLFLIVKQTVKNGAKKCIFLLLVAASEVFAALMQICGGVLTPHGFLFYALAACLHAAYYLFALFLFVAKEKTTRLRASYLLLSVALLLACAAELAILYTAGFSAEILLKICMILQTLLTEAMLFLLAAIAKYRRF